MKARLYGALFLSATFAHSDLLIRDVNVIDVESGTTLPNRSILIREDHIAAIGVELQAPKAQIIDGNGKYVIPGLWDMHVHLVDRNQLPMYCSYGITGVRDMGSNLDRVKAWRAEIQSGSLVGPHVETCGPAVDGFPAEDPKLPVNMVRSPNEARTTFDRLDNQSVDFIGILPRLPRDAYFALIERARKWYSSVAGPVPATVTVLEAIDARQRTIDQMFGILLACSTEEKRFSELRALALDRRDWEGFHDVELAAADTFNAAKADELFRRMAMYDTRAVPTLVTLRTASWAAGLYPKLTQLLIQMQRDGVGILAGTDAGVIARPGETLHQELELLVAAGMTPLQALRTATLEPAKYLDALASLGAVAHGKIADLVLLDANPLSDIRNTRKIAAVVNGGKYLSKSRLSLMQTPTKPQNTAAH